MAGKIGRGQLDVLDEKQEGGRPLQVRHRVKGVGFRVQGSGFMV